MSENRATLEQECRVFTRLIARAEATPYVVARYVDAHRVTPPFATTGRFESWLLAIARAAPLAARLADGYARLFLPRGVLRKKLVLALAILESSAPFHRALDRTPPRPFAVVVVQLACSAVVGILTGLTGSVIFAPLSLVARLRDRRR